jgi:hypothetical protein
MTKWACKDENHEEFNSETYSKKHVKLKAKHHGGYSAMREEQGEFQPGVDKKKWK